MNSKLAIAIVCLIGSILLLAEIASGAEFVDSNTPLHFGISAGAGLVTSVMTVNIESPTVRRTTAFSLCMVPGVAKELSDAEASGADLFWDAAGCGLSIYAFDTFFISADDKKIYLSWRF